MPDSHAVLSCFYRKPKMDKQQSTLTANRLKCDLPPFNIGLKLPLMNSGGV